MSKIIQPSLDNTILKSKHIVTKPIYVSKAVASDMFGVSKSTIYKWCQEAEESEEWRDLSIRPSAGTEPLLPEPTPF